MGRDDEREVHVHVHMDAPLVALLQSLTQGVRTIMATLDDLVAKVAAISTVEDSVIALLTDIKARLDAAIAGGADPVKLQALSDAIDAQTAKLTDAVTANTPAA